MSDLSVPFIPALYFHLVTCSSSYPSRQGFYVLDPSTPSQLILGAFQGRVACPICQFLSFRLSISIFSLAQAHIPLVKASTSLILARLRSSSWGLSKAV